MVNRRRITIEHEISKEQRVLLNAARFRRPWKLVKVEVLRLPTEPKGKEVELPSELEALAMDSGVSVPVLLDQARNRWGSNVSIEGLIHKLKMRGLR